MASGSRPPGSAATACAADLVGLTEVWDGPVPDRVARRGGHDGRGRRRRVGLIAAMDAGGAALVALVAAVSPPAVRWYRSRLSRRAGAGSAGLKAAETTPAAPRNFPAPGTLTTDQLCLAWRTSFTALQKTRDVAEQARLAQCRRDLLDELECRDPAGFARWFADGARAASNPGRYVTPPVHRSRRQST